MRILLVNVPHPAIGSRIPDDHLPPLGLLAVGGPLIDDGHEVRLIDADLAPTPTRALVEAVVHFDPDIVLFGHSGSTSGHPVIAEVAAAVARARPDIAIVYGGVYPTYHWREILLTEPHVTAIVCGEGEETTRRLVRAMAERQPFGHLPGLAFLSDGQPVRTAPAPLIGTLDDYRIGWELIDHARYSYWGGMRAVVAQFSRGCPHQCTYCGQNLFWRRWRHRDPVAFAKELARLHREEGVKVINLADENPTSSRRAWKAFLEALIDEDVDLILVGSTRAGDIVRDADILHLYRKAGVIRFLLGLENTDTATLERIKKGSTTATDRQAIRLLRRHGILSMATSVVGFREETDRDYWRMLRQLLAYDPDQVQILYATPHRWTPYFDEEADRTTIQPDRRRWDYKHQVLATGNMAPWRVLVWVKFIEAALQCRPRALYRTYLQPDRERRHAMRWYTAMGRRVWPYEILSFFRERRVRDGPSLRAFWTHAPGRQIAERPVLERPERLSAREVPAPRLSQLP
ncbi:anaerobic magnesium-protoporphyrin IX monomethyl ester cyclase [Rhodobium orientis]|uniref:Magnesium-protoporphyrin IX monomethyl ester anaerobic oxidative cyclase n=1 Tax=Rhodobium orientis TaxID=34017 RepID=A0A327JVC9_9HYPH|nr:magnesium-protoporphyrin IX monomethyl ester anaerobic oxidative cyclase [Rhodobium orientis]MBB4303993.1 anaerobic magnesium-protoporphyrin IX monomethyl ester cyclase [Rhodobium orientis]MBK5950797.1 magnesium-protoporphyrin IX monomethyl ester anaerobic oxidative cyclase [Rhodobium orientis]RAI29535.1 magnesium-protoporphyrin IX monomethyl ester anaerobic oxidative cyclase [Rhodobium orientis]